jgi:hypothetical protein
MALAASASAGNGGRVFVLKHPAPKPGDAFAVEHKTSFLLRTVGGGETGHFETASAFKVKVLARAGEKLHTRLELDPTVTTTDLGGKSETESTPARSVETDLDASELSLLPAPSNDSGAVSALAAKGSVEVGETWTAERSIPFEKTLSVPVKSTYVVASGGLDPKGHDLVKVVFKSEGSLDVGASGVKVNVSGEGSALLDLEHADRPIEVKLAYRFVTSGGAGQDAETRTETTIDTHELGAIAPATSASGATESSR